MKLPKLDFPTYSTILPVSLKEVKYRPYTVKEEKIILLATVSKDEQQLENAVIQILENCCSVDILKLHPTDVEWLFIKIKIVSVGNETEVDLPVICGDDCPTTLHIKIDLDNEVEVRGTDILENSGYIKKKDGWLVKFTDNIGMILSVHTTRSKNEKDVLWDCFVSMYVGDEVISKDSVTKDEFIEYMDELPRPYADKIDFLFRNQPWLVVPFKGNCKKCGKEHSTEIMGILSFLE